MLKNGIYRHHPKLFSILLLSIFTSSFGFAVEQSNISIIDNALNNAAIQMIQQCSEIDSDTIYTDIKTLESDRYFYSVLLKYADSAGIAVFIDEITGNREPFLDIKTSIRTSYSVYDNDYDSLSRRIEINYSGSIRTSAGKLVPLNIGNFNYGDIISRYFAELYHETDFEFAKSTIPEQPETFWDDFAKPIAIIGAAAVTVVLLFTLRSN